MVTEERRHGVRYTLVLGLVIGLSLVNIACTKSQVVTSINVLTSAIDAADPIAIVAGASPAVQQYLQLAATVTAKIATAVESGTSTRAEILDLISQLTSVAQSPAFLSTLPPNQQALIEIVVAAANALVSALQQYLLPATATATATSASAVVQVKWKVSTADKTLLDKDLAKLGVVKSKLQAAAVKR